MEDVKMPQLLTPELIQAIANNVDAVKSALTPQYEQGLVSSENLAEGGNHRVTRIRFILCNVVIINRND